MQAVMETLFDAAYLITVITIGVIMIRTSKGNRQSFLFGIMALVLGIGDSFHLIPRAYALWTTGLSENAYILGIGKFITSITMTVFYVILYHIFLLRYHIKSCKTVTISVYTLAALRIILCLFPQNKWTSPNAPILWGIYRNIPFALLGILIIILFYRQSKLHRDKAFRYMWLAITLSFALYVPVVLWADVYPIIGVLMIPKTLAYVWVVFMGKLSLQACKPV